MKGKLMGEIRSSGSCQLPQYTRFGKKRTAAKATHGLSLFLGAAKGKGGPKIFTQTTRKRKRGGGR